MVQVKDLTQLTLADLWHEVKEEESWRGGRLRQLPTVSEQDDSAPASQTEAEAHPYPHEVPLRSAKTGRIAWALWILTDCTGASPSLALGDAPARGRRWYLLVQVCQDEPHWRGSSIAHHLGYVRRQAKGLASLLASHGIASTNGKSSFQDVAPVTFGSEIRHPWREGILSCSCRIVLSRIQRQRCIGLPKPGSPMKVAKWTVSRPKDKDLTLWKEAVGMVLSCWHNRCLTGRDHLFPIGSANFSRTTNDVKYPGECVIVIFLNSFLCSCGNFRYAPLPTRCRRGSIAHVQLDCDSRRRWGRGGRRQRLRGRQDWRGSRGWRGSCRRTS